MCQFYCTSEGPSTKLVCLHCKTKYCGACLHGEAGKMESLVKCAKCGKKPRTLGAQDRKSFGAVAGVAAASGGYSPSAALKMAHKEKDASEPKDSVAAPRPTTSDKKAKKATIFDKLTDPKLYTGTHVHRFDDSGKGKGLAGRDAASGQEYGGSKVNDISQILRPGGSSATKPLGAFQVSTSTEKKAKSPKSGGAKKGPSIFDKLTDSSLYTGAHKHRFDASGKGKGMAGRDAASGQEYGGKVNDLSQIMRPNH